MIKSKAPSRRWTLLCEINALVFSQVSANISCSDDKDLPALSALGHFLKGSSATLGLTKMKDSCEKIQHFGARKDETGQRDVSDDAVSLRRTRETIDQAKQEFNDAEKVLKKFYHES